MKNGSMMLGAKPEETQDDPDQACLDLPKSALIKFKTAIYSLTKGNERIARAAKTPSKKLSNSLSIDDE